MLLPGVSFARRTFSSAMFPGARRELTPQELEAGIAPPERLIELDAGRGRTLAVVHRPPTSVRLRHTLFFYGNGNTLADTPPIRRVLGSDGAGVTCVDYPGYGASTGRPSEAGCHRAAAAALDLVEQELGAQPGQVDVVGYSMGSAVALQLAATRPVRRLVLLAPFTGVVPWVLGRVKLDRTPFDRLGPFAATGLPVAPTLVITGDADVVTPLAMARQLQRRTGAELVTVPGAGHEDLFTHPVVWKSLLAFLGDGHTDGQATFTRR